MEEYNRLFVIGGKTTVGNMIMAAVTMLAILLGVYYLLKGVYWILGILAPVLLIATLIVDYTVVTGYLKFLWNSLKSQPLLGITFIVLSVVLAPFLAGFLFAKAFIKKSLKKKFGDTFAGMNGGLGGFTKGSSKKEDFTEYEIIRDEQQEEAELKLPQLEKSKPNQNDKNEYEDLF